MTGKHHAALRDAELPHGWPEGVYPISTDGLSHLGVARNGELHWDGKPIVTRKSFTPTLGQQVWGGLIGLSAILAAGAACVSAYAEVMAAC